MTPNARALVYLLTRLLAMLAMLYAVGAGWV